MSPDRRVVLDASAVLAWALRERGARTVSRLMPVAVIPASAMVETLYRARERGHGLPGDDLHLAILGMGARVESVTDDDTVRAAELIGNSRHGRSSPDDACLSLGDGLCLAVAERLNLPVTGGDEYWSGLPLRVEIMPFRG